MGEYALPLLFLVAVFIAFGLAHRNRRIRSCGDCGDDCDKSRCDRT